MPKNDVDEAALSAEERIALLTHRKIEAINKYYPQIGHTIEEALFKELKCRTKYDDMAKKMTEYADAESPGIRAAFTNTADLLRRVQEYRVTYTRTVRQRVQQKLGEYAEKCKEVAELVKSYETVLKTKEAKHATLKKAKGSSSSSKKSEDVKKKEKAYSEANTAMVEKRVELLTQLQDFEESKLRDLKSMLRDFIQAQMWYFSRGLETLSRAYEEIDGIDEETDMKELHMLQRATRLADEAESSPAGKKPLALTVRSPDSGDDSEQEQEETEDEDEGEEVHDTEEDDDDEHSH